VGAQLQAGHASLIAVAYSAPVAACHRRACWSIRVGQGSFSDGNALGHLRALQLHAWCSRAAAQRAECTPSTCWSSPVSSGWGPIAAIARLTRHNSLVRSPPKPKSLKPRLQVRPGRRGTYNIDGRPRLLWRSDHFQYASFNKTARSRALSWLAAWPVAGHLVRALGPWPAFSFTSTASTSNHSVLGSPRRVISKHLGRVLNRVAWASSDATSATLHNSRLIWPPAPAPRGP